MDEEGLANGGGDLDDLELVNPRKTLAKPPERDGSGDDGTSSDCGDMCSSGVSGFDEWLRDTKRRNMLMI